MTTTTAKQQQRPLYWHSFVQLVLQLPNKIIINYEDYYKISVISHVVFSFECKYLFFVVSQV